MEFFSRQRVAQCQQVWCGAGVQAGEPLRGCAVAAAVACEQLIYVGRLRAPQCSVRLRLPACSSAAGGATAGAGGQGRRHSFRGGHELGRVAGRRATAAGRLVRRAASWAAGRAGRAAGGALLCPRMLAGWHARARTQLLLSPAERRLTTAVAFPHPGPPPPPALPAGWTPGRSCTPATQGSPMTHEPTRCASPSGACASGWTGPSAGAPCAADLCLLLACCLCVACVVLVWCLCFAPD